METNFLPLFNVFVSEIGKCNDLIIFLYCTGMASSDCHFILIEDCSC